MINVDPFWGDKDTENPQDFIRAFNRAMGTNTKDNKAGQFPNYLHADGAADDWYGELTDETKANWDLVEREFHRKWPKRVIAKKTTTEYEEELLNLRLKETELGKKETIAGREVYTHIAWADKIQQLAMGAKVETGTTYIGQVRKNLPSTIKEKVDTQHRSWGLFLQAVRDVDIEHIKDGMEELKKRAAERQIMERRIQQLEASPTVAIRKQLTTTTISPATRVNSNADPFGAGGGRGNLFGQQRTERPLPTPAERTALQNRIAAMPHHPTTEAGRQAHQAQQQTWVKTHGINTRVTELTPYPLRPGTAPVNSRECFKCGHTGHIGPNCTTPANMQLHPNESNWRAICSRVLRENPTRPVANIRLVTIDDYGTQVQIEEPGADDQGNEEGLPA